MPVELWACPIQLRYDTNVRRPGEPAPAEQALWLVEVRLRDTKLDPWLLVTDWPVGDAASALRIFRMYRQRWAVEDSFKVSKECLGWEEVQVLNLRAIRTLVALAWVATGFLYDLGVTLEWAEVWLLARLGGWVRARTVHRGKLPSRAGCVGCWTCWRPRRRCGRTRPSRGACRPRSLHSSVAGNRGRSYEWISGLRLDGAAGFHPRCPPSSGPM